ncbi:hypothetical protein PA7_20940 [Pseudonocardia asaccharolytica DSM 44247 = NBRC 16224]|uniref:Uncharacterized protein n=1 Tax=Pseudonocardia asaccharolytica DSM 44247 = NBRC 16224 TaxID=1123024 RepID=A0A511D0N1_9PSEU|nr:hypothetical protein PA7_20940 [Pseudonocardia asaccharolytica DSM 44247 = NBRC 16224]
MRGVCQLSLFSAEARPVRLADLAGLLCGPGQIVRFGTGTTARLSIVLADPARAPAVRAVAAATGVRLETVTTESSAIVLRTAFRCDLVGIAGQWMRGAAKAVPDGFQLDGSLLRLWALAAGRPDGRGGYLLALDPHATQTHQPLIAAATRAGIPPARVGRGWGAPALRIGGTRRVQRLVELVGPPPGGVPVTEWPRCWGRDRS